MQRDHRRRLCVCSDISMGVSMELPARAKALNVGKGSLMTYVAAEGQCRPCEDPLVLSETLVAVDGEDLKLLGMAEGSFYVTTVQVQGSPEHFILVVPQEAVTAELTVPNVDRARQWCQDSLVASRALTALNCHLGELLADVCVQHGGEALLIGEGQVQYLVETDSVPAAEVKQLLGDSAILTDAPALLDVTHFVTMGRSGS